MEKQLKKIEEYKTKYDYLQEIRTMQYISNANILKHYSEERLVKLKRWQYLGDENIELVELSLKQRRQEDSTYIKNKQFYWNLTKGLTILDRVGQCVTVRRGLRICYEVKDSWVEGEMTGKIGERLNELTIQALQQAFTLQVVYLQLPQGQESMISYNCQYKAWTIGYADKSIFIQQQSDVIFYQDKPKLTILIDIYHQWMQFVNNLSEKLQESLLLYLDQKTLLFSWHQQQFQFYGLVNHIPKQGKHYVNFSKANKYLSSFGIDLIPPFLSPHLTTLHQFMQYLRKIITQTRQYTLSQGINANLIFIEANKQQLNSENKTQLYHMQLIQLKVQTIEYQILEKVKDKFSVFINFEEIGLKGEKVRQLMEQELEEIVSHFEGPKRMGEYLDWAVSLWEELQIYKTRQQRLDHLYSLINKTTQLRYQSPVINKSQNILIDQSPLNIIVISPMLYFLNEFKESLQQQLHIPILNDFSFNSDTSNQKHQFYMLNSFPNISNIQQSTLNQKYFVFIGYSQVQTEYISNYVKSQPIHSFQQQDQQIIQNIDQYLLEQVQLYQQYLKTIEQSLPQNFQVIDDYLPNYNDIQQDKKTKLKVIQTTQIIKIIHNKNQQTQQTLQTSKQTKNIKNVNPKNTQKNRNKKTKQQINILIIIPIGIPAMGKSYLASSIDKIVERSDISIKFLSNDLNLKDYIGNSKNIIDQTSVFEQQFEQSQEDFNMKISKYFKDIKQTITSNNVLFLNQTYTPKSIKNLLCFLKQSKVENLNIKQVALIPESFQQLKVNSIKAEYPFSMTFLLNCISRSINRNLKISDQIADEKLCHHIFTHFNYFKNFKLKGFHLLSQGFDHIIQYKYTQEDFDSDSTIDQDLQSICIEIIKELKNKFNYEQDHNKYSQFLDNFANSRIQFKENQINMDKLLQNIQQYMDSANKQKI